MKNFIPYNKLSPKQRRAVDKQSRVLWEISPVTRRPENPKAYHRAKLKQEVREQAESN
ncbi:MAG: hypothetical protein IJV30_08440 [Oscillospiraceae bacterium]|nr:hypothetical protein [Oscillospiraceae bacterium]